MRGKRAARVKPQGPHRRCVGCRQVKPQAQLFRLVAEGGLSVPGKGKPGRGCWLCRQEEPASPATGGARRAEYPNERCAREAVKGGQIARAFKGKAKGPALGALLEWIAGLGSLDGDGGRGLKS